MIHRSYFAYGNICVYTRDYGTEALGELAGIPLAPDNAKGVPPARADKLRKLLFALKTADNLDHVGRFPEWKLHPLKGDLKSFWSLSVTRNWRLIFQYDEETNTASDIDLIDYH